MDGLLVVDKPAGPTSHDVVARVRRALAERRVGHTGTLDPAATGVLALVLGRATRLAQFLSGSSKSYEAVVRFGFATDTGDAQGRPVGPSVDSVGGAAMPTREVIDEALSEFRGNFLQQPPAFSAKKVGGKRSHKLARARVRHGYAGADAIPTGPVVAVVPALPAPARVTVHRLEIVACDANSVTLTLDCSAGFYVRSLAHDLGERLGVGAHLAALRRTRVGDFSADGAISLDAVERNPAQAAAAVVSMAAMLPRLPGFTLTPDGVRRAMNGCELGPADGAQSPLLAPESPVRLLDQAGTLVGIARTASRPGFLHPSVIVM
jgi:tRNA pseudouridine55 synthase